MARYRIVEWDERYEVTEKGHEWSPGAAKRKGSLVWVRFKVHGKEQGVGWRKLLARAGKAKALMVFGFFGKLLELAACKEREQRGYIDPEGDGGLAYILGVPNEQVRFSLQVLADIGWIQLNEVFPGNPGVAGNSPNQTITTITTIPPIAPQGACAGDVLFDRFWSAYPKKVAKDAARKAFDKRSPDGALFAKMLAAIEAQKRTQGWKQDGGRYIPHPATWLNQGRWDDAVGPVQVGSGPREIVYKCYICGHQGPESQMKRHPQLASERICREHEV